MNISDFNVKLYADGANLTDMLRLYKLDHIQGFTTNPTLMHKAGITDYEAFAKQVLTEITDRPISFEVFSDEFEEMFRQAQQISSWGDNVYVKIPITNTKGDSAIDLIQRLSALGVKLNVTAIFTLEQVTNVAQAVKNGAPTVVSVFAGRIADAGIDPLTIMSESVNILSATPNTELLWASPREVFNVVQADQIGCDIITATPAILDKLKNIGKDLDQFSLETVKMFYNDAQQAGFKL